MPLFGLVSAGTASSLKSSVSGVGDKVDNFFNLSSPDGHGAGSVDPQDILRGQFSDPNAKNAAMKTGQPLSIIHKRRILSFTIKKTMLENHRKV